MPEWLIILSTLTGLAAGVITVYEFIRKPTRTNEDRGGLAGGKIHALGKNIFRRLLNYARFEFLMTRTGGFFWFIGGFASFGYAEDKNEKLFVLLAFIASGAALYMIFVYPLRKRTVSSIRRSAIESRMYDECIDQIALNSGLHKYRFSGIRKVVHECVDELRR
jgi:hypothetical protein